MANLSLRLGRVVDVVSWNINSVRARMSSLVDFLTEDQTDIVLLQETKCIDDLFPKEQIEELGYNCAIFGQKSYNGVAILSKHRIEDITFGREVFDEDPQTRYIEAFVNNVRIASVYVPNGQSPNSLSYKYKLAFLEILKKHVINVSANYGQFIIGGDFNIAPTDMDVYDPELWRGRICCTEQERRSFFSLLHGANLTDCFRSFLGEKEKIYTWWDYRNFMFQKDKGLRLDHFLVSEDTRFSDCQVIRSVRALRKPSDHAPIKMRVFA